MEFPEKLSGTLVKRYKMIKYTMKYKEDERPSEDKTILGSTLDELVRTVCHLLTEVKTNKNMVSKRKNDQSFTQLLKAMQTVLHISEATDYNQRLRTLFTKNGFTAKVLMKSLKAPIEHSNHTKENGLINKRLYIKGWELSIFNNVYFRDCFRDRNTLWSDTIHLAFPTARRKMRHYNSTIFPVGRAWREESKIPQFCLSLLGLYFP
jgi:hypothetical protein